MKKIIRDLIIGEDQFIESVGEFKQAILSGQFALLGILISVVYALVDVTHGTYQTLPIFAVVVALMGVSIYFHRKGRHCRANCFLLPTLNITIYLIASSESPNTGVSIFFISTSIAAFAVFSYKQRLFSILFAVFTYMLFVLAYFVDFSLLSRREYSEDMMLFNIVVNFSAALPASVMAIYLMINLNHYNALQLVANNKLLSKTNAELDRFVYSTSHDLRAPLTSVLGLIDITQRSGNMEEMMRYLGMMRERVFSLDKFIKDITDYSRNNRLSVTREPIKLRHLTNEIWESLQYTPEAENIQFQIDIPEQLEVYSDKNRLSIVLGNLLSNAIRYHDLRKAEKFIRVGHEANGKGFYLKVEDNGQGIPAEYHNRIFEMFYRANETAKGSGLGLYIVKETMQKLSGSINVKSEYRVGSTFTAKFPY